MQLLENYLEERSEVNRCVGPELVEVAKEYIAEPDAFIRTVDVTINGKLRHLITYMPNEKGWALRCVHKAFASYLQRRYRPSAASFAYIKKKNIVMCVKQHLHGTVFLKTDIHAYFDSVSEERMIKRIRELRRAKGDWETIELLTKASFYKGHLPIGFITSPVLSDLFLVTLDRKYKKVANVTYTRYADDFIVSATGENARKSLADFRLRLEQDLGELDLELNRKKTYIRTLKIAGDAIHVLGLNIVKTEMPTNRITVSDRYIRKTCKDICTWFENGNANDDITLAKIRGQIAFIRQCSADSYRKLEKMVQIKCGEHRDEMGDPVKLLP